MQLQSIQNRIYEIRGQNVILDFGRKSLVLQNYCRTDMAAPTGHSPGLALHHEKEMIQIDHVTLELWGGA